MSKKLYFLVSYDVMLEYICVKKKHCIILKKCKYTQQIIEMIFNLYEIYYIY
jgi:hypothetical protein